MKKSKSLGFVIREIIKIVEVVVKYKLELSYKLKIEQQKGIFYEFGCI